MHQVTAESWHPSVMHPNRPWHTCPPPQTLPPPPTRKAPLACDTGPSARLAPGLTKQYWDREAAYLSSRGILPVGTFWKEQAGQTGCARHPESTLEPQAGRTPTLQPSAAPAPAPQADAHTQQAPAGGTRHPQASLGHASMTTFSFAGLCHPCMSCDIIPQLTTQPKTLRTKDWRVILSGKLPGPSSCLSVRHKPVTGGGSSGLAPYPARLPAFSQKGSLCSSRRPATSNSAWTPAGALPTTSPLKACSFSHSWERSGGPSPHLLPNLLQSPPPILDPN